MFPEVCPSCGAAIDPKLTGRSMTCRYCGRTIQAIDDESRSATTVADVKKQMSLGNRAKAHEMTVAITDRDPDDIEAWILRGNTATTGREREMAFKAADKLAGSIPSDMCMAEFVWNPMIFNWRCSLIIDGETSDLGPGMMLRSILSKGDHDVEFRCNTNGMTVSKTITLDSFTRYKLEVKTGFFSRALLIEEMKK